jgi:uncharacterized protein (TIGR00730 family)
VRLQLELLKPELVQREYGIRGTVVVFGSSRIPDPDTAARRLARAETLAQRSPEDAALARKVAILGRIVDKTRYHEEARRLAALIAADADAPGGERLAVITGGGPGIMEAANRDASEAGGNSIGLNIVLPHEQWPNAYVTPDLSFRFHYFAIRKMHFLLRARALVACPGGFGTLDELFETLTLIQTGKVKPVPVLLFGQAYWERIIDFGAMVEEGTIDAADLALFRYVETAEQAWREIRTFRRRDASPAVPTA